MTMFSEPLPANNYIVGIISDTHGLLRPSALEAFEGSHMIIHSGDIGSAEVLDSLKTIAPVVAVRGNVDCGTWAEVLPETEAVEIGDASLFVLHNLNELDLDPCASGFSAVISGHSHRPSLSQKNGVYFINPGSAGPRRFNLPITVARLNLRGNTLDSHIIEIAP